MDPVEYQYNEHPYPDYSLLAGPSRHNLQNIRYAPMALRAGFTPVDEKNIKILLMGCGTAEPLTFATAHPKSSILAVDLSESSLTRARKRLLTRLKFNVEFQKQDLLKTSGQFQLISAYGVLHHLQKPKTGFQKINELLAPNGIARVMVYSKISRQRWTQLSQFFKAFGLSAKTPHLQQKIYELIDILPADHPLKSSFYLNTERKTLSGIVDCFFHAQEHFFTLAELLETTDQAGLEIFYWQNHGVQNLEQLFLDEALDELEGNFVFWVKKKTDHSPDLSKYTWKQKPELPQITNAPFNDLGVLELHWPSYYLNTQLLKNIPSPLSKDWKTRLRVPHIPKDLRKEWLKLGLPTDESFGATALDREDQIKNSLQILESKKLPPPFPNLRQYEHFEVMSEDLDLLKTWIDRRQTAPFWIQSALAQMPTLEKIAVLNALFSPLKPFSKVRFKQA